MRLNNFLRDIHLNYRENHPNLPIFLFTITITLLSSNINAEKSLRNANLIGKPNPAFTLKNLQDQEIRNTHWKGKLILINFWATWCSPCIKEIPMLNNFQKQYSEDGLQIIGIAIDNKAAIKKFTRKIPIKYPVLLGNAQIILDFGNQAGTLPYTVFIDQKGIIVEIASGMLTKNYLQHTIEKYL